MSQFRFHLSLWLCRSINYLYLYLRQAGTSYSLHPHFVLAELVAPAPSTPSSLHLLQLFRPIGGNLAGDATCCYAITDTVTINRDAKRLGPVWEENISQEKKPSLAAERVHTIFRHISDEACYILGMDPKFASLDWMLVSH